VPTTDNIKSQYCIFPPAVFCYWNCCHQICFFSLFECCKPGAQQFTLSTLPQAWIYAFNYFAFHGGAQWHSGMGTTLQTSRSRVQFSMVTLEFFSDIIFQSHYGPGVDSASNRNEYQVCFLGGKGGRCVRLTPLPPSCATVMKSGNPNFLEPCGPLQACNGTAWPFLLCFLW